MGSRPSELGAQNGGTEALARELRRDLGEEVHPDYAHRAAAVILGQAPPGVYQSEDFDLPDNNVR